MNVNEAIDDLYTILGQHNGEYMDYASYEAAVDNLNIISNFVAGTRWIPVSERLPETVNGKMAVMWQDGEVTLCYARDVTEFIRLIQSSKEDYITNWIQLPEPPQEVE